MAKVKAKEWTCAYCSEVVRSDEDYRMVALDIPYLNLFYHGTCFLSLMGEVTDWNGLEIYLAKNLEMWYN